ncbi:chaperone protein dnaJ 49-like [Amaranthus tricolor]|uniref:chaperone protein dnaJ 49-like n=1 Tax=Amaranthus tricolor TaxID=29722 RepID=UPI00258FDA0E|nr:chaperone protein dnaJ 49-like [Amaranthus tricolor]XP_057547294.1 chaperone protein dnaJ 49-like [Amaranthus tricolor]
MDSNKDEALKCIGIAKEAIASGNKDRALKFIRIAQRLNHTLSVDDLIAACENMDSSASGSSQNGNHGNRNGFCASSATKPAPEVSNGERNYTEEHVKLIKQINKNRDYYAVLGVEKTCSVEEIRKAYRKLSLKVHPDKNKAPGAEDAFKKVCKAFKCLSEEDSRRQYDQTGLVDEFEYNQQHNVRRRRRGTHNEFFDEGFDPDEIFRAFFGQSDMFRTSHVYRTRGTGTQQRTDGNGGGPNFMVFLQLVPFLLILLLAYLPFSEPEYSLQRNYSYQFPRVTEEYGVEFYVKSPDFDRSYPIGSAARENLEENVIQDYKNLLGRYCHVELQRRQWSRNLPTPYCDKLQSFGVA